MLLPNKKSNTGEDSKTASLYGQSLPNDTTETGPLSESQYISGNVSDSPKSDLPPNVKVPNIFY